MFYGLIERELLKGTGWFPRQEIELPLHIQMLVDQAEKSPLTEELPNKLDTQETQEYIGLRFLYGLINKIFYRSHI